MRNVQILSKQQGHAECVRTFTTVDSRRLQSSQDAHLLQEIGGNTRQPNTSTIP